MQDEALCSAERLLPCELNCERNTLGTYWKRIFDETGYRSKPEFSSIHGDSVAVSASYRASYRREMCTCGERRRGVNPGRPASETQSPARSSR